MISQALKTLFISLMLLTGISSLSYADFYVISVPKNIDNVVTVAISGAQYSDVQSALDAITDAAVDNPYLLHIGPGIYTVTSPVEMKSYVTIMGSGENITILRGAVSAAVANDGGIIEGVTYETSTLANLSVENTGGGIRSVGIYLSSVTSFNLYNVSVTVSGSDYNTGIWNYDTDSTMINITATATGGLESNGIKILNSSSSSMTNITATATGGDSNNGVYNSFTPLIMTNVTATAIGTGAGFSSGVNNIASSPQMSYVTATASEGTINYGLRNTNSGDNYSFPFISHSELNGLEYSIYSELPSIATVSLSTLAGGGVGLSTTQVCSLCVDESDNALAENCQLPAE